MRFSMILEMVDRLSAPAKRARGGVTGLRSSIRDMAQQVRGAARDVNSGTRSIDHFQRRASRLRQVALGRTFQAIGNSARRMGRDLDGLVRRLRLVERGGEAARSGLRKLGGGALDLLKNGVFAGGAAVAGAGAFAMFDLFRTAGQFEQYQIQLEGIEGSAKAAKSAMAWVTEFAKVTPYELDEVMEAFTRLKGAGLDPLDGTLKALGDGASGNNKQLLDAVEMMQDAMQGGFERLKEFNVSARVEGNRTVLSYVKGGKAIQKVVEGTRGLPIRDAINEIFNDRFGGGMERQSKTMFGIISNLKGMWTEFLLMIAKAGIFDFVKGKLQGLLDKVNEMAANGELEAWAKRISDKLTKAWEWGEKFINSDWNKITRDFADIAEAVGVVADLILSIKRLNDASADITPVGIYRNAKGLREALGGGAEKPATAKPRAPARLPSDNDLMRRMTGKQASADLSGTLKIDVSSASDLSVRATPVAGAGSRLAMETRTGRTMRSAA